METQSDLGLNIVKDPEEIVPENITKKLGMKSIKRQRSLKTYFRNNKQKSPTIISSYDIIQEMYIIKNEDIEDREFKAYFIETIQKINNNNYGIFAPGGTSKKSSKIVEFFFN